MKDLAGKIALVTGAASGIGLETSRLLASYGVTVVMSDINAEALADPAALGCPGARTIVHDVSSEEDWRKVFAFIEAEYGHLDILVNNAGIMRPEPFEQAKLETLRLQNRINVESVYIGMHGALPLMKKALAQGRVSTSIINVSSVYGMVAGSCFSAYSATKGAVRALTKAVALELAGSGVRVNCILPGPAATNLSASWDPPRDADGNLLSAEEALAPWVSLIPVGRIGMADDMAPVIAFLASDMAKFVTGAEFVTDGGYTAQ